MIKVWSTLEEARLFTRYGNPNSWFRAEFGAIKKIPRQALKELKPKVRAEVRKRYTYREGIPMRIHGFGDGAKLVVAGRRMSITHFRHNLPKWFEGAEETADENGWYNAPRTHTRFKDAKGKYLEATVVRGQKLTFYRAFYHYSLRGSFYERKGKPRYPIRQVMGPSIAEMAGHEPSPANEIKRALEAILEAKMGAMM